jgi:electron transfer flavoprotein beta subunit
MGFHVVVCMKMVPDPEAAPESFTIDGDGKRISARGVPPVMSPFDENALEAAIRLKESAGARLTIVSVGGSFSQAVLLKAMATGADDVVLVRGDELDTRKLDSNSTAALLAAAVRRMGDADLVLAGRQASDTNAGQVGIGIAHMLGIPAVTTAQRVEVAGGILRVERVLPNGYEVVRTGLPAVVTVSHEVGELRYPKLAAIKAAKALPREELSTADLGIELPGLLVEVAGLSEPERERRCVMVEAEEQDDAGRLLAERLRDDGVV